MKKLVCLLFFFAACGSEPQDEVPINCHFVNYDKVGQNVECPDAGPCECQKDAK